MRIFAIKPWLGGLAALATLVLVLGMPGQSAAGVLAGLRCCANQVIPALFPFFIVSNLILASPLANWLGLFVWPFSRFVLGLRQRSASTALLMSWLGGFAVAAEAISTLYKQGRITQRQAQLLLVCGVGSGPAFVINAVGLAMLGSVGLGACLFAALLCASLASGLLARLVLPKEAAPLPCPAQSPQPSTSTSFVQAVQASVQSMLAVCAFVVFFRFLSATLTTLFPGGGLVAAILLEVTTGCAAAAALPKGQAVLVCAAALSSLSLSVLLQVRALLCSELSLVPLLATRPFHLGLTLGFLSLFLRLVPGETAALTTLAPRVIAQSRTPPDTALVLFLLCCLVLYKARFTAPEQSGIIKSTKYTKNRNEA